MTSMGTLFINTPYPFSLFSQAVICPFRPRSQALNPSQVQAQDLPRLRISNGLIKPNNGKLVELFVKESKKGETKKEAMTL
ncbi:hypothetical protein ACFX15_002929 [Malus domestica]